SYPLPDTIGRLQSEGAGTQLSGGKKTGSAIARQPIQSSTVIALPTPCDSRRSRATNELMSGTPLAAPKTSHASQTGNTTARVNRPKPAIALCGAFSLKKKSSPELRAANRPWLGRQKLTSRSSGRALRNWYQSKSVLA